MSSTIPTIKMTRNTFLDGEKPGETHVDDQGQPYEVVAVFGPQLSDVELRRLRRAALRLHASPEPH
jgi:hypothetical protein